MVHTLKQSRGYSFERHIVKELNKNGWCCKRLGGSSLYLPDELAVNNLQDVILAIEAKSTVGDRAYVPQDQIIRCNEILKMFSLYERKYIVFAFKFSGIKAGRKLKHYYVKCKVKGDLTNIDNVMCNHEGLFVVHDINHSIYNTWILDWNIYKSIEELKESCEVKKLKIEY